MKLVDLVIFLPKEKFSSHNLKILLSKIKKVDFDITYLIVGEDNICESYSGDLFQCFSVEEAIKDSLYGKSLFLVGGKGTLDLKNNTLVMSYLNSYDCINNFLFLEKESIEIFLKLKKILGMNVPLVTKDPFFYSYNQLTPIDEDVVEDGNLLTTRKRVSNEFVNKIIEKLREIKFYKVFTT